jgi:hypothetical protein
MRFARVRIRFRTIRLTLDEVKAVRYRVQGTTIVQSTSLTAQAAAVLKKLAISPPKRVLAVEHAPSPS